MAQTQHRDVLLLSLIHVVVKAVSLSKDVCLKPCWTSELQSNPPASQGKMESYRI